MQKHQVKTTPQIFINDEQIGGFSDLKVYFDGERDETSYRPIINIFGLTLLMALAITSTFVGTFDLAAIIQYFMAFSVCTLAALKLKDIESFSSGFLNYDLLAKRWVKYAYIYPYAEAFVGISMLAIAPLAPFAAPVALFIGIIGAISVFKAVYIEKGDLKCACVGGESNVPLGFISLTENLMMVAMGVWMLINLGIFNV